MIGSANLDGSDPDYSFIAGPSRSMATDSGHLYWHDGGAIARANLDGTEVDTNFISDPGGAPNAVQSRFIATKFDGYVPQLAVDSKHIYWNGPAGVARANLDGTGVDLDFMPGTATQGGPVAANSSRVYWGSGWRYPLFTVGNARRHEHRGTAKLPVTVSGPGELVLGGHGLRSVSKTVASDETYQLAVKPKGRKKRKLERRGHVRVWTKVTLALPGTDPRARVTPVELIQR
jgi:hypothetical protein